MKRSALILFFIVLTILNATAQGSVREKLDTYKIGFFTKRLNLTSSEAEKFWPAYNEFQSERTEIQLEKQQIMRSFNQNELNMNNAQLEEHGDKLIGTINREADLASEFHKKLKGILSPVKVMRFYQAENQFRLQLLRELQNRQQNRRDPDDLP